MTTSERGGRTTGDIARAARAAQAAETREAYEMYAAELVRVVADGAGDRRRAVTTQYPTGYHEAKAWLDAHTNGFFRIKVVGGSMRGDMIAGYPNTYLYNVQVVDEPEHVLLTGEGTTILEATQAAMGWKAPA